MWSYYGADCFVTLGVSRSLARESIDLYACAAIDRSGFEGLYSISGAGINFGIKK